jgi:ribonuclease HI
MMPVIYSDGGADSKGHSAGACIVEFTEPESIYPAAAYLGTATNNEAEIFSAIMGFAFTLLVRDSQGVAGVRWVSDSEYSIKSATQYIHGWKRNGWKTAQKKPVKNQGLWKTFDALVQGIKIVPEHVYGHSGHPENEACDTAVGYLRAGQGVFEEGVAIIDTAVCSQWHLVDGRELLDQIRKSEETGLLKDEVLSFFSSCLSGFPDKQGKATGGTVKEPGNSANDVFMDMTRDYLAKIDRVISPQKLKDLDREVYSAIGVLREKSK